MNEIVYIVTVGKYIISILGVFSTEEKAKLYIQEESKKDIKIHGYNLTYEILKNKIDLIA
jgi:hypothetical protein